MTQQESNFYYVNGYVAGRKSRRANVLAAAREAATEFTKKREAIGEKVSIKAVMIYQYGFHDGFADSRREGME